MADQLLQDISQPPSGANLPRGYWLFASNNYTPFKVKAEGRMFVPDTSSNDKGKLFTVNSAGLPVWEGRSFDELADGELTPAGEDLTKYSFIVATAKVSVSFKADDYWSTGTATAYAQIILLPKANFSANCIAGANVTSRRSNNPDRIAFITAIATATVNNNNTGLSTGGAYYGVY